MNQSAEDISTRQFLAEKGFTDLNSILGIRRAKQWLKTADPDDLFITEGDSCAKGDPFDLMMAEMRRNMILRVLERMG